MTLTLEDRQDPAALVEHDAVERLPDDDGAVLHAVRKAFLSNGSAAWMEMAAPASRSKRLQPDYACDQNGKTTPAAKRTALLAPSSTTRK